VIKVLIIDGQNNHKWEKTTPILQEIYEESGRYEVEVSTSPRKPRKNKRSNPKEWKKWRPDFSKYDVVVSNYNGEMWPEEVRADFVKFVKNGGGFVTVHAADNAFALWPEYNEMIGLGGWGKRNTKDELYALMRGPGKNMTVLATAPSKKSKRHEPMLMALTYGEGRVFHTTLGHDDYSMRCRGFYDTLLRGTEWAATNKVTIEWSEDFPTKDKSVPVVAAK